MRYITIAINDFERKEHGPMILIYLLNDFGSKSIILINVPFRNEKKLKKLMVFTKEKYDFRTVW